MTPNFQMNDTLSRRLNFKCYGKIIKYKVKLFFMIHSLLIYCHSSILMLTFLFLSIIEVHSNCIISFNFTAFLRRIKLMVKFIHCADLHLDSPFKSKSHLSPKIFEDVQKVHMKVLKIL